MKHIKPKAKSLSREELMKRLPPNYVNKPGTIIMFDDNYNPMLHDNGDGTVSGFDVSLSNNIKNQ